MNFSYFDASTATRHKRALPVTPPPSTAAV